MFIVNFFKTIQALNEEETNFKNIYMGLDQGSYKSLYIDNSTTSLQICQKIQKFAAHNKKNKNETKEQDFIFLALVIKNNKKNILSIRRINEFELVLNVIGNNLKKFEYHLTILLNYNIPKNYFQKNQVNSFNIQQELIGFLLILSEILLIN